MCLVISYISLIFLGALGYPYQVILFQTFVPKTKLNIRKCTFCVAVSTIWIQLPIALTSEIIDTFRKQTQIRFVLTFFSTKPFGGSILQWQVLSIPVSDYTKNDFVCCASELEFLRMQCTGRCNGNVTMTCTSNKASLTNTRVQQSSLWWGDKLTVNAEWTSRVIWTHSARREGGQRRLVA